jgi:circadian clock protein KaiC
MNSIGMNLDRWRKQGLLFIRAARPSAFGLEMHLVQMHQMIRETRPRVVVLDPISSLLGSSALQDEVKTMVLRMVDHLKHAGATALFTALADSPTLETTEMNLSSLVDTWIQLKNVENDGERNRLVQVLKSRGMAHSNQVREFNLSDQGIELNPVYLGSGGVLTGSARILREAQERMENVAKEQEWQRKQNLIQRGLRTLETQIHALQAEKEAREQELALMGTQESTHRAALDADRQTLSLSRRNSSGKSNETKPNGTANKSGGKRI